jgi:hypothetical protein
LQKGSLRNRSSSVQASLGNGAATVKFSKVTSYAFLTIAHLEQDMRNYHQHVVSQACAGKSSRARDSEPDPAGWRRRN